METQNNYAYQNIFDAVDSSELGLDKNEAIFRLKKYGLNELTVKKGRPLILRFLEEFSDPMILLLIFAVIIAFFSGDSTDATIILIVVLLNGLISFIQKFKAEKAVEALKKLVSPQARVLRQHQQILINTNEVVPGDIIILSEGDTIPADAIVFAANELQTSEAILTGESFPVAKHPFNMQEKGNVTTVDNIIFTGTTVARGNAKALVIKTGMETEFGKIANLTQETKKDATPLEKEIHKIGILAAQITIVIITIIFIFELLVHQRAIVDNILFAASIAVAAVPEGLPAVITIALALGVQRLSRQKAIMRQLSSVETLGATTVICTDKTGTLTKNEMTVTEALIDDFYVNFAGAGYTPSGKFKIFSSDEQIFDLESQKITPEFNKRNPKIANALTWFSLTAEMCNNSSLEMKDQKYQMLGDPTEGGLLSMARKIASNQSSEIKENLQEILELPFDSERKMMSKLFMDATHSKYYVFTKGAPENVVKYCDQRLHGGRLAILTKSIKEDLLEQNEKFNQQALRTIALAYKELSAHEVNDILSQKDFADKLAKTEKKLIFIGLAGLSDPPREDVKEAVRLTKVAGIKSYIVTGDHGFTTAAIAKKIGMIDDNAPYEIITGEELDQVEDQSLMEKFRQKELDIIFSRTKPEHKLRLVSLLKQNREIVAVTGDGVNDAPALKRADIGIAMDISGSDVSKEAANMVLMDDSFDTIVTAIREGRTIYANLKKFIFYIFSSNIGELFTIFVSLLIGLVSPLTAILILTVNLATDLFPALALGLEPAEKDIMEQPPRHADEKIMNRKFIIRVLTTGCLIGLIILSLYVYKLLSEGWIYGTEISDHLLSEASSLTFIIMVFIQVANAFNAKSEDKSLFQINIFNNHKLIWANLSSVLIAIAIVEIPFFQQFFHTSPLPLQDWILVGIGCVSITIFLEIVKFFSRKKLIRQHA